MACAITLTACHSDEADLVYEYPTILTIAGSTSVNPGIAGFTTVYSTYYLGPGITYSWNSSSASDVTITPDPKNITKASVLFKPSGVGKKITISVTSSNGITGTKEVTVN